MFDPIIVMEELRRRWVYTSHSGECGIQMRVQGEFIQIDVVMKDAPSSKVLTGSMKVAFDDSGVVKIADRQGLFSCLGGAKGEIVPEEFFLVMDGFRELFN